MTDLRVRGVRGRNSTCLMFDYRGSNLQPPTSNLQLTDPGFPRTAAAKLNRTLKDMTRVMASLTMRRTGREWKVWMVFGGVWRQEVGGRRFEVGGQII